MHELLYPLTLPADPTNPAEAATKRYVDSVVGGGGTGSITAGAGLTLTGSTLNVGAGTGITVAADTIALNTTYTNTLYSPIIHTHPLSGLSDIQLTSPITGNILVYNATTGKWANAANSVGTSNLDALSDVVINLPSTTQVLTYNGTNWVNAAPTGTGGTGGTGVSAATITVAASNATTAQRAAADFVCDGTNDEVQIQSAIDSVVPSGNNNISVMLTQGTFNLSTGLKLRTGTSLKGMGKNITILKVAAGFADPSGLGGEPVISLFNVNTHATELSDFRIDGNNFAGNKPNGIWFNNTGGVFTTIPDTSPDPVHYIHDIYIRGIGGNGINFSVDRLPTITSYSNVSANTKQAVIYNTIVRTIGEHCYWLFGVDSVYISLSGSGAGENYSSDSIGNPRPGVVLMGGNNRIASSKIYSGNSHGWYFRDERSQTADIEAQDTGDHGIVIRSSHATYTNIFADSCGRLTADHASSTPLNPNAAGIYVAGLNNTIRGQVVIRNRGWGTRPADFYQYYAVNFDSNLQGSDKNVVEIHSQLTSTDPTPLTTAWFTGIPKVEFMRLTNGQSGQPPRFWIENVETPWGDGTGGTTTAAWPHVVTYTTEPETSEIQLNNRYYSVANAPIDGTGAPNVSLFRNLIQIKTGPSDVDTMWINEWGGFRAKQPPEALWDSHVRLIRGADDRGSGNPIEYQNAARDKLLTYIDWSGNVHAPNVADRLEVLTPASDPPTAPRTGYVREKILVGKWYGSGVINNTTVLSRVTAGVGDIPFGEVTTTNAPIVQSEYINFTVYDNSTGAGANSSWALWSIPTAKVVDGAWTGDYATTLYKFNMKFVTNATTNAKTIVQFLTAPDWNPGNWKALFALKINGTGGTGTQNVLRIDNSDTLTVLLQGNVALVNNNEYVIQLRYTKTGSSGNIRVRVYTLANVLVDEFSVTVPALNIVSTDGLESGNFNETLAIRSGLLWEGAGQDVSAVLGKFALQEGTTDPTENITITNTSVELASKAYVDAHAGGGTGGGGTILEPYKRWFGTGIPDGLPVLISPPTIGIENDINDTAFTSAGGSKVTSGTDIEFTYSTGATSWVEWTHTAANYMLYRTDIVMPTGIGQQVISLRDENSIVLGIMSFPSGVDSGKIRILSGATTPASVATSSFVLTGGVKYTFQLRYEKGISTNILRISVYDGATFVGTLSTTSLPQFGTNLVGKIRFGGLFATTSPFIIRMGDFAYQTTPGTDPNEVITWVGRGTETGGESVGWETVATWVLLPPSGNWPGRQMIVEEGIGLLVAVWNGTEWVVDPVSDSGEYDVTGELLLANGWTSVTGSVLSLRRIGNQVQLSAKDIDRSTTGSGNMLLLSDEWKPVTPVYTRTYIGNSVYADDVNVFGNYTVANETGWTLQWSAYNTVWPTGALTSGTAMPIKLVDPQFAGLLAFDVNSSSYTSNISQGNWTTAMLNYSAGHWEGNNWSLLMDSDGSSSAIKAENTTPPTDVAVYVNGSYVTQGSPFKEAYMASHLERHYPLAISVINTSTGMTLQTAISNSITTVKITLPTLKPGGSAGLPVAHPNGTPSTFWPLIGSTIAPGANIFSRDTCQYVSWVRIDNELIGLPVYNTTDWTIAAGVATITNVVRGCFGTVAASHSVSAKMRTPIYIGSVSSTSNDQALNGNPVKGCSNSPPNTLRYGVAWWDYQFISSTANNKGDGVAFLADQMQLELYAANMAAWKTGVTATNNGTTTVFSTSSAHGYTVNTTIAFAGYAIPDVVKSATKYYVQSVPSTTSFTVSTTFSGAAIAESTYLGGSFNVTKLSRGDPASPLVHGLWWDVTSPKPYNNSDGYGCDIHYTTDPGLNNANGAMNNLAYDYTNATATTNWWTRQEAKLTNVIGRLTSRGFTVSTVFANNLLPGTMGGTEENSYLDAIAAGTFNGYALENFMHYQANLITDVNYMIKCIRGINSTGSVVNAAGHKALVWNKAYYYEPGTIWEGGAKDSQYLRIVYGAWLLAYRTGVTNTKLLTSPFTSKITEEPTDRAGHEIYKWDFGTPVTNYDTVAPMLTSGVYVRQYTKGMVVVNMTSTNKTYALPYAAYDILTETNGDGALSLRAIGYNDTIPANDAKFYLKPVPV